MKKKIIIMTTIVVLILIILFSLFLFLKQKNAQKLLDDLENEINSVEENISSEEETETIISDDIKEDITEADDSLDELESDINSVLNSLDDIESAELDIVSEVE